MGGVGLGGAMITASRFADSPGVFAGIVEIAIAGYVLVKLMALAAPAAARLAPGGAPRHRPFRIDFPFGGERNHALHKTDRSGRRFAPWQSRPRPSSR